MPFRLSHVVLHTGFVQTYIVERSSGDWVNGRWTEETPVQISVAGVVSVAQEKDLQPLHLGDQIKGAMIFHSVQPLYVTRAGTVQGTSDIIIWNGQRWRLLSIGDYSDYGYYKAIGERISGC
jgi:hypothetical protein